MKSPTAMQILTAAADRVGADIKAGATAEEWRDIAMLIAERTAEWFIVVGQHLAEESFAKDIETIRRQKIASVKSRIESMAIQKQHMAFTEWAKNRLAEGCAPKNLDELQGLAGFKPAWSGRNGETLKKWARDAGFRFRGGRPKKKI